MDITRTYRINAYPDKEKYMKIPYTNKTNDNKVYELTSSDPSLMQIVNPKVIILAGEREKF